MARRIGTWPFNNCIMGVNVPMFRLTTVSRLQVLTYGIASAAVLRLTMILLGAELIDRFQPVLLGFAALLLYSSYKLLTRGGEEEDGNLSDNNIVRLCRLSTLNICIWQFQLCRVARANFHIRFCHASKCYVLQCLKRTAFDNTQDRSYLAQDTYRLMY